VNVALLGYCLLLAVQPETSKADAGIGLMATSDQGSGLDPTNRLFGTTRHRGDVLLSRQELAAYRGWIKYLGFQAEREVSLATVTNHMSCTNVVRFAEWVGRIEANPNALGQLRGVQEWAYESRADDSGQPFALNIPTDYAPGRPPGLLVNLHYATGDHHQWMAPHKGMFDLTNGFGHDVWKYDAGHRRAASWRQHQVRPDSRRIESKRIYRMATIWNEAIVFGQVTRLAPPSFRMTDLEAGDVFNRFFLPKE
jgi:hypothetical protein